MVGLVTSVLFSRVYKLFSRLLQQFNTGVSRSSDLRYRYPRVYNKIMVFVKVKPVIRPKNYLYPTQNSRWIDSETGLRKNFDGTLEKPQFMKIKTGKFTKPEKKVVAKIMYEAGWGGKRIAQWLNVSTRQVLSYKDLPTPEAMQLFQESFKAAMIDYDLQSTFNIKSQIMKLVPSETNIDKLVKAGEFFQGKEIKTQNNTQVNVYGSMLKKYGEGTTEMPVSIISKKQ